MNYESQLIPAYPPDDYLICYRDWIHKCVILNPFLITKSVS